MMGSTFPMCKMFGIEVNGHYTLPIYALFSIGGGMMGGTGGKEDLYTFGVHLLSFLILFLTVLVHEFGHSWMTILLGGSVKKIMLWPFGGLAYCAFTRTNSNQLKVSFAGPATHLPMVGVWLLVWFLTTNPAFCGWDSPPIGGIIHYIGGGPMACFIPDLAIMSIKLNIMLFLFNLLLPIYPLDGSKIFVSIIMMCCGTSIETTAKISVAVSVCGVALLAAYAAYHFEMFTMFILLWLAIQILHMYKALRDGTIKEHPVFMDTPGGVNDRSGGGLQSGAYRDQQNQPWPSM